MCAKLCRFLKCVSTLILLGGRQRVLHIVGSWHRGLSPNPVCTHSIPGVVVGGVNRGLPTTVLYRVLTLRAVALPCKDPLSLGGGGGGLPCSCLLQGPGTESCPQGLHAHSAPPKGRWRGPEFLSFAWSPQGEWSPDQATAHSLWQTQLRGPSWAH